ncbi:MAG: beta-glucosidase BglX [Pseudomonadota bacterium]
MNAMDDVLIAGASSRSTDPIEHKITSLLADMTLEEKIGQMRQVDASGDQINDDLRNAVKAGRVGSVINQVDPDLAYELQGLALEESRLGIPLLIGRDVIHGFETVAPLPLAQAASWNPELVRDCARIAAREASSCGVNWTFAPMIDISRDPRWGRIAESFGEDPFLTSAMGVAMVEGFQGDDLSNEDSIAACAKHFAGYGASESGRDYNTTNIPENELRNIYLPPFKAAADAGAATFMASFSDIDGVPATANAFLLRQVLRDEWAFDGFMVSDWDAVRQLSVHGLTENDKEAAFEAASAGVDMEMTGDAFVEHLAALVNEARIDIETIDQAVANILRVKLRCGLFDLPFASKERRLSAATAESMNAVKALATESVVLLKNDRRTLPLQKTSVNSIAVIGPMANAAVEQLGTWTFDGDERRSVTPLAALHAHADDAFDVRYVAAMESTRSLDTTSFDAAVAAARDADLALLFVGEDAILSGEAHCRADISLPGVQSQLVKAVSETGTPVVAIIMAGRPLTLGDIVDHTDAILFAWHPGSMAGPALCDLLFGVTSPSGKLPVTFPKMVGQIPIYYNHKNTGRPPSPSSVIHIDDIEIGAAQTSLGMTAFHLDAGYLPQFPFGFGLSYSEFEYRDLKLSADAISPEDALRASVVIENKGAVTAQEVVQLYIRDLVGSVTRPVKELKGFKKIMLKPGQSKRVSFELTCKELSFYRRDKSFGAEAGEFQLWIGGSSVAELSARFSLT